jgi:hypothetical protein
MDPTSPRFYAPIMARAKGLSSAKGLIQLKALSQRLIQDNSEYRQKIDAEATEVRLRLEKEQILSHTNGIAKR